MTVRSAVAVCALLLAGGVASADELKSGPQVGDGINGGFRVACANGRYAGKHCCPV